jgi:hypothetical protein
MGAEAMCTAHFKRTKSSGKARLETDALHFRGDRLSLVIPFKEMTDVAARQGQLRVTCSGGVAVFDLGSAAAKWVEKIRHPPSRLQKLGVKPEWRVSAIGIDDEGFLAELERAVAFLSIGRTAKESDAIFYGVSREAELTRIEKLKGALKPNGALWTIRPKGRPEISEGSVMAAGKAAGLVDVKVVSFSPTHTAEKFVIPLASRPVSGATRN